LAADRFRFDPNATCQGREIRFGEQIEDIKSDYMEDPVFRLHVE